MRKNENEPQVVNYKKFTGTVTPGVIEVMKPTEEQEQEALFNYALWQKEPEWQLLFAIPNGGYRKLKTGIRMKKTGLKPGIPDMMLPVVRGNYPGLFIEMKSEKGVVRPNQKAWHDTLRAQGYKVESLSWMWGSCQDDQGLL